MYTVVDAISLVYTSVGQALPLLGLGLLGFPFTISVRRLVGPRLLFVKFYNMEVPSLQAKVLSV